MNILLLFPGFIVTGIIVFCYEHKIRNLSTKSKNNVHFYVARDKDGTLWLYSCKPIRGYTQFYCRWNERIFSLSCKTERFGVKKKDYDYLKWEDEPVEVFLNLEN